MTEAIQFDSTPGIESFENFETLEALVDDAKRAVDSSNFERAFEIIHQLDVDRALCPSDQEIIDLVRYVCKANGSEGVEILSDSFERFYFSIHIDEAPYDRAFVSIAGSVLDDSFSFQVKENVLGKIYALFLRNEKSEELEQHLHELSLMYKERRVFYIKLADFISKLAEHNVRRFEEWLPLIHSAFNFAMELSLERNRLNFVFFEGSFERTWGYDSDRFLFRDYSYALRTVKEEEDIGLCFEIIEMYPEKAEELLKVAKEIMDKINASFEFYWALFKFADYYIATGDRASFDEVLYQIEKKSQIYTEEVHSFLTFSSVELKAKWSLHESDQAGVATHLSRMKQVVSKLSFSEIVEEGNGRIKELEEKAIERFGSDTLSMQSMKA